jgi:hypothetical protein
MRRKEMLWNACIGKEMYVLMMNATTDESTMGNINEDKIGNTMYMEIY